MTTPKALSREHLQERVARLRRSFASFGNEFAGLLDLALAEVEAHIAALEKERAVAVADNAALWRLADHAMAAHVGARERPHILEATKVLSADHSGAALLEEHDRALVRARNEGREEAAASLPAWCDVLAKLIRDNKEPET